MPAARTQRPLSGAVPRICLLLIAVAAAAGLGACGGTSAAAHKPPEATVQMVEYKFVPPNVTVHRNASVAIINDGTMVHSWVIPKAGVGTPGLAPGATEVLELSGIAPGTYGVLCDQPGHAQLGQVGTITVLP